MFVPVDFASQTLRVRLSDAGFDGSRPALFSLVGTTMYLSREAIEDTLRVVGGCAEGSEIVLSYNQKPQYLDGAAREFLAAIAARAAERGEPLRSSFAPTEIEELAASCGLSVVEHPTADDLCRRYCSGRADGLRPYTLERLVTARR